MTENASAENFPQSRNCNLTTQEIGDEILIYDLEINRAFCLNRTSALVWQQSNGRNSVASIAVNLSKTLREPVSEHVVRLALDQLNKENLLTESVSFLPAERVSRRKLLREAALTSAVALPIISAIVAPTSAQAQSSCIQFGDYGCRTEADCCPSVPPGYDPRLIVCQIPFNGTVTQCSAFMFTT